ncbi:MAG: 2-amino-4-hydroxy-6-hydroxymethyldihydropteridine diphosphokinase [Oscillospiraceae bacterium]|nr:2-amino-4-hydroxy-6-hydroxymethyldihydropteridine diphosphokinase [Oscillospiraceae bacterium]
MSKAVIGLGSNLGDRFAALRKAVVSLALLPQTEVVALSKVYETEPVDGPEQPNFYNAAVLIETQLSPYTVLGAGLGLEAAAGRLRTVRNGPRTLDVDLLLYENVKSESFELTLPHPRILERAYVLIPLNDLFPSGRGLGLNFGASFREIDKNGVRSTLFKLRESWED